MGPTMQSMRIGLIACLLLGITHAAVPDDRPVKSRSRTALRAFNDLIGTWRGTGTPEGTREQKQRGFWTESLSWEWQFQGDDAWLKVAFDKGKHFVKGELRYLPAKDHYQLTVSTPKQETLTFAGPLKDRQLTLERKEVSTQETQRLVLSLLHANRFLYRYEVKPADRPSFTRRYQVGATKEGVPFAAGDGRPECVVSGGLGTMPVSYKGKTYYVCCSGCRDAFKDEPEKYIKEYEERKAQEAKEQGH